MASREERRRQPVMRLRYRGGRNLLRNLLLKPNQVASHRAKSLRSRRWLLTGP